MSQEEKPSGNTAAGQVSADASAQPSSAAASGPSSRKNNRKVPVLNRSQLVETLSQKQKNLGMRDIELTVKSLLDYMAESLASGQRIELRGFGSFSLHRRPPRIGRNPMTGMPVRLPAIYAPHFKPGKILRHRVNNYRDKNDE